VIAGWSVERALASSVLVCAGFALAGWLRLGPELDVPTFGFALASLVVGAAVAITAAVGLERVRAGLARRQRELTDLSARLMSVHEEERQRLSRELHDELGQSLTAVLSYLWLIERQVPESTPELRSRVGEARRLASGTLAQIRELSQRLRPSVLDDYGLVPSLEAHVKAFGDRQEIVTTFHAAELPARLSADVETAVFRITQEALGNVARHARARHVHVSLGVEGRELTLEVHDDGIGVEAARANGSPGAGMGLIGIRERVRALGGRLSLTSEHGARLEVRLPLPPDVALPAA
jgi:signal transduction histidine kinase